ncbi:MAG: OmpA family protein [Bacteroidales bacterium]|nr:OmpA family protein [Bacteroidales bacterium]
MKRIIIAIATGTLLLSSCVTLGKYEALENKNNRLKKEVSISKQEMKDMQAENAELLRQNESLSTTVQDLRNENQQLRDDKEQLQDEIGGLKLGYDTIIENYMQQVAGKSRDLTKANNLLTARTRELEQREEAFAAREREFKQQQAALTARQKELEQKEASTRRALAQKESELKALRNAVNNALVGFADKGLNVESRDGKVYVSLDSKLMFASGSWTVSKEGNEAIANLAKVLEENPDLNIMIEGHTDNDPFNGKADVRDNWDLSVMRATAILKLLLKNGPKIDPARVEACGHGEFAPKAPNDSPAGKAQNRRTEIILTPNLGNLYKIVN